MTHAVSLHGTLRKLGRVFVLLGGALWAVALVLTLLRVTFLLGASRVEGVSVAAAHDDVAWVEAAIPGTGVVRVKGSFHTSPAAFAPGQRAAIYFDPDRPAEALIDAYAELWFLPTLFGALGAPFVCLGAVFLLLTGVRNRHAQELRRSGQKLVARVIRTEPSAVRINHRRASILIAEALDPRSGAALTFRSEAMLIEPEGWVGRHVTVHVDPDDAHRYAFELSL